MRLRVECPNPTRPNAAVVTILIDGEELSSERRGFMGFDPDDLFAPDAPLLPTWPPRRVAVYRCGCGEAGCGCMAPIIRAVDDLVVWADFRDFTGVYVGSTVAHDPDGGKTLDVPDFVFDAQQYRTEVERASADRSWETLDRATGRHLRQLLHTHTSQLEDQGYRLTWAGPHFEIPNRFSISLYRGDEQIIIQLDSEPGDPVARATEIAETFLRTDPDQWPIERRHRTPRRSR